MQRSVAPCSFTLLFDMPTVPQDQYHDENTLTDSSYTYHSSSSSSCSSPVDCTLSLGPSSTRQSNGTRKSPQRATATTTCMPAFRWDIFSQSKHNSVTTPTAKNNATSSGSLSGGGGDPLLARRCANCDTTSTPLWRNGPRGPKSLCNACGIRYKKEERRAAATTMTPYGSSSSPSPMASETQKPQQQTTGSYGYNPHQHDGNLWGYTAPSSHRSSSMSLSSGAGGEFRFSHGYDSNADSPEDGALPPYLSWCLNVPQPRAEYLHHY